MPYFGRFLYVSSHLSGEDSHVYIIFVKIGQSTVPNNILIDIIREGIACMILPPVESVLVSDRIPVNIDAIPIVSEGPNINAIGTVSIFCICGGGSIFKNVFSISL